jgi:hypothetical protein
MPPMPPARQLERRSPTSTSDVPPYVPRQHDQDDVPNGNMTSVIFTWIGRALMLAALVASILFIAVMTQELWRGQPREQAMLPTDRLAATADLSPPSEGAQTTANRLLVPVAQLETVSEGRLFTGPSQLRQEPQMMNPLEQKLRAAKLQEQCADQAKVFFQDEYAPLNRKTEFFSVHTSYASHYNAGLNRCFILAQTQYALADLKGGHNLELLDVSTRQQYAHYSDSECKVHGAACQSEQEWLTLVKPYLEELADSPMAGPN